MSFSFEKTLKQKLAQKSSGNANEETVLLKAFKYFDLNNNGTVEPDEFAKAVEKIGIMIPTRQVSEPRSVSLFESLIFGLKPPGFGLCVSLFNCYFLPLRIGSLGLIFIFLCTV